MNPLPEICVQFHQCPLLQIGNCDIDFYNFRHRKVRNFEISNQFKRHQNFTSSFEGNESKSESQKRTSQFHESPKDLRKIL